VHLSLVLAGSGKLHLNLIGFVEFHLLKGPEAEDHTLYARSTLYREQSLTVYLDNRWTACPRKTTVVDHVSTFGLVISFIIVISW
jgi:hypothetical protein